MWVLWQWPVTPGTVLLLKRLGNLSFSYKKNICWSEPWFSQVQSFDFPSICLENSLENPFNFVSYYVYTQKCMFTHACTLNDYFHYEVFLLISLNIQGFFSWGVQVNSQHSGHLYDRHLYKMDASRRWTLP